MPLVSAANAKGTVIGSPDFWNSSNLPINFSSTSSICGCKLGGVHVDRIVSLGDTVVGTRYDCTVGASWIRHPHISTASYNPTGDNMQQAFLRTLEGDLVVDNDEVVSRGPTFS